MKTVFQNSISVDDLKHVTKLLHPELPSEALDKKFKCHIKYTWVVVQFSVPLYGMIDFAIDNHHQNTICMMGPLVSKPDMAENIAGGKVGFYIWRMSLDKYYNTESVFNQAIIDQAVEFIKGKYYLPSADEYYRVYYQDSP